MQGKLWWAKFQREIQLTVKLRRVTHAAVPGTPFFLVVASAKEWNSPWYLLTNEPLQGVEDALRIVQIYTRRWHIEWSFRFEKSELGSEHIRVREWEAHLCVPGNCQ
jgi:IS4 transposase